MAILKSPRAKLSGLKYLAKRLIKKQGPGEENEDEEEGEEQENEGVNKEEEEAEVEEQDHKHDHHEIDSNKSCNNSC